MTTPSQGALDDVLREIARPIPMPAMSCRSMWGHRFEARYDTIAADAEAVARALRAYADGDGTMWSDTLETVAGALSTRRYRGDVCVRCGMIVNVPPEEHSDGD